MWFFSCHKITDSILENRSLFANGIEKSHQLSIDKQKNGSLFTQISPGNENYQASLFLKQLSCFKIQFSIQWHNSK